MRLPVFPVRTASIRELAGHAGAQTSPPELLPGSTSTVVAARDNQEKQTPRGAPNSKPFFVVEGGPARGQDEKQPESQQGQESSVHDPVAARMVTEASRDSKGPASATE